MIEAVVGDSVLVREHDGAPSGDPNAVAGSLRLVSSAGVVARWSTLVDSDDGPQGGFEDSVRSVAVLEDPPRLAFVVASGEFAVRGTTPDGLYLTRRVLSSGGVVVVDVATGELQARVRHRATRVVAFSPAGDRLYLGAGQLEVLDAARLTAIESHEPVTVRRVSGDVDRMFFPRGAASPAAMLMRARQYVDVQRTTPSLTYVDSAHDIVYNFGSMHVGAVVVDRALTRCVAVESVRAVEGEPFLSGVVVRNVESGGLEQALFAQRNAWMRVWSDDDLEHIAAIDQVGVVSSSPRVGGRATKTALKLGAHEHWSTAAVDVDVVRGRFVYLTSGHARVVTLAGRLVAEAPAHAALIEKRTGNVVIIRQNGNLAVLGAGAARNGSNLEGPSRVLAIAQHRRGIIALDDQERAHVIEL